jgi:hypothetical protein
MSKPCTTSFSAATAAAAAAADLLRHVQELEQKFANLPAQGSAEWLAGRRNCVGGSEIASVLGESQYRSAAGLAREKRAPTAFTGNTATRWGTLFEPIVRDLVASVLELDRVLEFGSVPCEAIPGCSYSPDGLGVRLRDVLMMLLEFKCPYSKVPDGEVPAHYMPQVQLGLQTFPRASHAMFVNVQFRRCSAAEFDFTSDYELHSSREEPSLPIGFGHIAYGCRAGVSATYAARGGAEKLLPPTEWVLSDANIEVLDYGVGVQHADDVHILECLAEQRAHAQESLASSKVTGVLYFKVVRMDMIRVDRDPAFLPRCKPLVEQFVQKLRSGAEVRDEEAEAEAAAAAAEAMQEAAANDAAQQAMMHDARHAVCMQNCVRFMESMRVKN